MQMKLQFTDRCTVGYGYPLPFFIFGRTPPPPNPAFFFIYGDGDLKKIVCLSITLFRLISRRRKILNQNKYLLNSSRL